MREGVGTPSGNGVELHRERNKKKNTMTVSGGRRWSFYKMKRSSLGGQWHVMK